MKKTAETFGGIDILINNASAISLTPIEATPMKKFDLMNQVNVRGTYLCTRCALPYLQKSKNGHILTISPPLNITKDFVAPHTAYTIAKYGMSFVSLGASGELQEAGIASNTLWPRTMIATAAVQNLLGGDDSMKKSRTPELMADAAYVILSQNSKEVTGNFFIDDEVLKSVGVKDFSKYAVVPGTPDSELVLDLFL
eukprot:TRINITY_DN145_c0_g1_i5.p1 TRINITY_DN145_c0_g1~~TRINITY_DN145_c0_g1_i5.p1  ORF type:complete len:197 (-),score=80.23 TRINITY_DN145_c0_g1_i5:270-860(-)